MEVPRLLCVSAILAAGLSGCIGGLPQLEGHDYIANHAVAYSPTKLFASAREVGKVTSIGFEGYLSEIPDVSLEFNGHLLKLRNAGVEQLASLGDLEWANEHGFGPTRMSPTNWPFIQVRDVGNFSFFNNGKIEFGIDGGTLIDQRGRRYAFPMSVDDARELLGPFKQKKPRYNWDEVFP